MAIADTMDSQTRGRIGRFMPHVDVMIIMTLASAKSRDADIER